MIYSGTKWSNDGLSSARSVERRRRTMGRPKKPVTAANEKEAVAIVQKKRGLKPASLLDNFHGDPEDIGAIVAKAHQAMKMPGVKDDEELTERIDHYFTWCAEHNSLPMWEEMALYCGVVRETFWKWSQGIGCSAERSHIIKKAKEALATIDAGLAEKGKIQPVVYIFRAKNFFNMKDQNEVVLTPNNPLGEQVDQKALEAKIADVVVDAEDG